MVTETLARRGLALVGFLVSRMPRSASLLVGSALGILLGVLGWRRNLIRSNLQLAFPGMSFEARDYRRRVEKGFYRHFGNLILEIFCQFGDWKNWVLSHVEVSGVENWEAAQAKGKGVLVITSHLGNWEAMAAGFCAGDGAPRGKRNLLIVTKHLKPEWLHQAFEFNRRKAGVEGTYEPRTMKDVLRQLSRGGSVGFVLDQYAGAPIGVRVPFFGVPVGTLLAPAAVVRRTEAAVLPAYCFRDRHGRLKVHIGEEFDWIHSNNLNEALALNTARWVASIEEAIRSHPEQWLWSHRRFKGDLSPVQPGEWCQTRTRM